MWSIRDDYSIFVAERHFSEAGEASHLLARMRDRKITLPVNSAHWPAQQHLEWHRNHKFLGN